MNGIGDDRFVLLTSPGTLYTIDDSLAGLDVQDMGNEPIEVRMVVDPSFIEGIILKAGGYSLKRASNKN